MESRCSSTGCPKTPEYLCKCQDPAMFFCESHLSFHIGSKRKLEHRAMRLESLKPTDFKECNVCMKKPANFLCFCRFPGVKLCQKCNDLHIIQSPGKHTKESIDALDFIEEEKDIPKYIERKDMIDGILKTINENLKEADDMQNVLKISVNRMLEKIKKFMEDRNQRIEHLKRQLTMLQNEVRECKFKKNIENHWLSPFFREKDHSKIFRTVKIEIQDDHFDHFLNDTCKIDVDLNLLKHIDSSRVDTETPEDKETSGFHQIIQTCLANNTRFMHVKLKSLFETALQPLRIEKILSIELSNCMLENEGSKYLSQLLPALPQLRSLNLNSNNIGPFGIRDLSPSLVYLKNLETLMLS